MNRKTDCNAKFRIALALLLSGLLCCVTPAEAVEDDLWDVSQGTVVTSTIPTGPPNTTFPSENMFGGSINGSTTLLKDLSPMGTVHTVEWQTPSPVTVGSFTLMAGHDMHSSGPAQCYNLPTGFRDANHRGMNHFKLSAWNPATSEFDIVLYDEDIPLGDDDHDHAGEGAELYDPEGAISGSKNILILTADVLPVQTDRWRAEFTQHGCASIESGPRIMELDGFAPVAPEFVRGDVNADGIFEGLIDALYLLSWGFLPGQPAPPCLAAADADSDQAINALLDGLHILQFAFIPGAPPIAPPFPGCGPDVATVEELGCESTPCIP